MKNLIHGGTRRNTDKSRCSVFLCVPPWIVVREDCSIGYSRRQMKAIRIHEHGDPDVLKLDDIAVPEPGPGAVRVKIEAAGLNFIDIYQRSGQYKVPLPYTPGMEAAGIVDAVAEDVTDVRPGDRVAYGFSPGSYAQYAIVPANKLAPLPEAVSFKQAAALMLQGMTAHYLVTDTFAVNPGHTILIHAAAGATGQLVVQMAKLRGARVIATASSEAKLKIARDAGADEAVLYENFDSDVKRLTGGRGVDVVYDSVGQATFEGSLQCLKPRGMLVSFGQASGSVPPLEISKLSAGGSLFLTRPTLFSYTATPEELRMRAARLFGAVLDGTLKAPPVTRFALKDAAAAQDALEERRTVGKIILIP